MATMRSPYPDVEIPDVALAEFVYADAPARGDAVAIVDGPTGRSYSYAMLHHLVGRCAAGLAERGVQQHDVVGVFAPNIPEWPIVFHGVAQAGRDQHDHQLAVHGAGDGLPAEGTRARST